jgi:hypothetical protein
MFQDKGYLGAVLVAVCIPLLCDNAFRYSDKSGSSSCRCRSCSCCHRCCPQFDENKIEIIVKEIKEESENIYRENDVFRMFYDDFRAILIGFIMIEIIKIIKARRTKPNNVAFSKRVNFCCF